ncbi:hypothetical protein WJX74_008663 [Apatococcus lobatus]|uniref:Fungal lipase-type domain-containing protein n=1 Tax=Apatococcus lobatus TaxID=904363 RepID=A0AAW1RZP0_9CHLO
MANFTEVQDVVNSLLSSELVYKILDGSEEEAVASFEEMRAGLPSSSATLQRVQWSLPHVSQRYLLAESDTTLYVAFMGTKQRRDLVANSRLTQRPVWMNIKHLTDNEEAPSAHAGYLTRADSIPVHSLWRQAEQGGKRLIFCGHSLGGAVAMLCTLRLLESLPSQHHLQISCYSFASPAIGNASLLNLTEAQGWSQHMTNFLLPEDFVMRLLYRSSPPPPPASSSLDDAALSSSSPGSSSCSPGAAKPQAAAGWSASPDFRPASQHLQHTTLQTPDAGALHAAAQRPAGDHPAAASPQSLSVPSQPATTASHVNPGVLPRASYEAMQAAWLGTASALPHMSLTRLIAMFFLERSVAGLSSAWQHLLWLGALLLPLSSATPFAFVFIAPHTAMPESWLVSSHLQQPTGTLSQAASQGQQESTMAATHSQMSFSALPDAPSLVSGQQAGGKQPEAWQETASMVQVSLALGLRVGSPEKRLAQSGPEGRAQQEGNAAPGLTHMSVTSSLSSLGRQSQSLSRSTYLTRSSSSEMSLASSDLDSQQLQDCSSGSSASSLQPASESSHPDDANHAAPAAWALHMDSFGAELQPRIEPAKDNLQIGSVASKNQQSHSLADASNSSASLTAAVDEGTANFPGCSMSNMRPEADAGDQEDATAVLPETASSTNAAVPASGLEAWPGKGYFAIGKTLYLMPRAAEPQPDLSNVHEAEQNPSSTELNKPMLESGALLDKRACKCCSGVLEPDPEPRHLLWTHRMPFYRQRFRQIFCHALKGWPLPQMAVPRALESSTLLAPAFKLSRAGIMWPADRLLTAAWRHQGEPLWQVPWKLLRRLLGGRWRAIYIHVEGKELGLCTGAHLEMAGNVFKADIIPTEPDTAAPARSKITNIISLQHAWAQVRTSLQGCCGRDKSHQDLLLRVLLPLSSLDASGMPTTAGKAAGTSKHGAVHLISDFQQMSAPVQPQSRYGSRYLQRLLEAMQHSPVQAA